MINKRLLVKNLLAHNDENSFYDKKLKIELHFKEGKAKFLKHICALSNSNPHNNSYIVIGIDDHNNDIVGVDFFDDAQLQNLINAYLENPPAIQYENISFPHLPVDKVVGLVTIHAQQGITALRKNIWKYYGGAVFYREGSISMPRNYGAVVQNNNALNVAAIEKASSNNIELTLDRVMQFMARRHDGLEANYKVFKEQFVICWSGRFKKNKDQHYYSRVDIELVTEQVRLFYSNLDEVQITYDQDVFTILEFVELGLGQQRTYHPLERQTLRFFPNGTYRLENKIVFNAPVYDRRKLHHIYNNNLSLLARLTHLKHFTDRDLLELQALPETMLICKFNNIGEPIEKMLAHKTALKAIPDVYDSFKHVMRVLRKVKYNS